MKDLVSKVLGDASIRIKDKYVEFIKKFSQPKIKKNIFLRLVKMQEKKEKEDFSAKKLGFNLEVFLSFIFCFF